MYLYVCVSWLSHAYEQSKHYKGAFCWVVISLAHKFTNRALYGYPIPPYCDEETLLNCENISTNVYVFI